MVGHFGDESKQAVDSWRNIPIKLIATVTGVLSAIAWLHRQPMVD
jgi:hypothetical protein